MTVIGGGIRMVAIATAQHNFTHEVASTKVTAHVLVTEGIYRYMRHPGYFGWFWWCVGMQILICNPVCAIGFFYYIRLWFKDRIEDEESEMERPDFFGDQYKEYKKKTPTYIPGIP
eukprot:TRINITY_DN92921_c0_g1_i1.p1 TRINITY_DN92921_c0_g1~~TRINITY_DN92921_c0_g1_i1.p1  ORF type:complete len:136 (-),score=9.03 TRINITY_DN92921_c0_g1_i1:407-754(-)